MSLREIAFSRSGDKGDIVNVSLIAYRPEHWEVIREQVTVDMVQRLYDGVVAGEIERFELPGTHALNFVMRRGLGGGISVSLRVDGHGKAMQSLILDGVVSIPA
ncbi:hypothetical protein B6V72_17185 [Thioclava sp. F34-6]|nr:hypothetical protein B6V72_17185 [Thioclava sp. F34-6]